jgi:ABC-2 type transport system ATP-binding protein
MKSIIEFENLTRSFGWFRRRKTAVNDLCLAVPEGRITAFLGPNGAGKTTTLQCAMNLLPPTSGRVQVLGCDARNLGPTQLQRIGYVSENTEYPLWMSVDQFFDWCRPLYPQWDSGFEQKLRSEFELPGKRKLRHLSRGQRMKAALAASLAYRPRLVILDEPFSGLDPLVREEFLHGLLELTEQEGWSVLVSSHDIEEVERLADHVAILADGQLRLAEDREGLIGKFRSVEVTLSGEVKTGALPAEWLNAETVGRVLRFTDSAHDPAGLAARLSAAVPGALNHTAHAMSLREIFVALARAWRLESGKEAVA